MRRVWMIWLLPLALGAATFQGEGFGHSHKEAKKEALADLASTIKSEVRSAFNTLQKSDGTKASSKTLRVTSDLPIIGAEYSMFDISGGYSAVSQLDPQKAKKLYADKLTQLTGEIDTLYTQAEGEDKRGQYRTYQEMLTLLNNYERYRSVAVILELKNLPKPKLTSSQARLKLKSLSLRVDTIALAAEVLASGMTEKGIFVFPPKAESSNEITPFAKVVKQELTGQLQTVADVKKAAFTLRGSYQEHQGAMTLAVELLNDKREVVRSNVVELSKQAYAHLQTQPKSIDFDKLLHEGYIAKSSLKARIKTDSGDEDLLFVQGQSTRLFVKLNNPGYFYIVGHVDQKGKKFSYLLDLSESEGETKFVQYVDVEDANKWIMLGEFEIEPPFGIESIQMIASNKKITKLPQHYYDEKSGYHILGKDPMAAVTATRGLKKKKSKVAQTAEAVLMFTTMAK